MEMCPHSSKVSVGQLETVLGNSLNSHKTKRRTFHFCGPKNLKFEGISVTILLLEKYIYFFFN